MIAPSEFSERQASLAFEFAQYVVDNPEADHILPEEGAYIYFEVDGEDEFNEYCRRNVERDAAEEGVVPVCVRVRRVAPTPGAGLIDPQITITPSPSAV